MTSEWDWYAGVCTKVEFDGVVYTLTTYGRIANEDSLRDKAISASDPDKKVAIRKYCAAVASWRSENSSGSASAVSI